MPFKKPEPKTITEYISVAPKDSREKLAEMHKAIHGVIPDATESLKWGMPAFSYDRILVTFAGFKRHIGFYPTPKAIQAFERELSDYKTAKGSIQFPLDKPLPLSLIRKITAFRAKESVEQDGKWKS